MTWVVVAAGGALGSMLRHFVNIIVARWGSPVPYATGLVNIVGCLVIGSLAGFIAGGRIHMSESARAFVFVGILGGFTTFSSFGLDTLTLVHGGRTLTAAANVIGQVGVGLLFAFIGYALTV